MLLFSFHYCLSLPHTATLFLNIPCAIDTGNPERQEDQLIQEVIAVNNQPQKEKAAQLSQLTRFGFRNLFTSFNYNPSIPYSSQVNPNAELYMRDYLTKHRKYLLQLKTTAVPYFDLIDNIFRQYGLPVEMKYLAVIESSLKTGATSRVGAVGPWQFMPQTARIYGLKVNRMHDDRRDYFKSTHAAAKMLLELYSDYHDWLLVIAAYNGGAERVKSAISKTGSNDFWKLQYHLPEESRNHVKKFIATHYVMENNNVSVDFQNQETIVKPDLSPEELSLSVIKTISGKYNAAVISDSIFMDRKTFMRYNPKFDERLSITGQYDMRLPKEKMDLFIGKKYNILEACINSVLTESLPAGPHTDSLSHKRPVRQTRIKH